MTTKQNKSTFYKITNEDVYLKLDNLEHLINNQTSKVKINTWLASTSFTLIVGLILGSTFHLI